MTIQKLIYKSQFGEFEIEDIVSEPSINYGLFEEEIKDSQAEQLNIFRKLESSLLIQNASSFGSQVHFQNAFQTPVQRWFPYREGIQHDLLMRF